MEIVAFILDWIKANPDIVIYIIEGIIVAILGDALHDVVKGIENAGDANTKGSVAAQSGKIRIWSTLIIKGMKTLAEMQAGSKK
jgi:hypothetical protein